MQAKDLKEKLTEIGELSLLVASARIVGREAVKQLELRRAQFVKELGDEEASGFFIKLVDRSHAVDDDMAVAMGREAWAASKKVLLREVAGGKA